MGLFVKAATRWKGSPARDGEPRRACSLAQLWQGSSSPVIVGGRRHPSVDHHRLARTLPRHRGQRHQPASGTLDGRTDEPQRPPARILVYAQEWSLWLSRSSLPARRVTVALWNRGQDAHDLWIRRLNVAGVMTGAAEGVGMTQSGGLHQGAWRLAPGAWLL
jgi:hypothetical protein